MTIFTNQEISRTNLDVWLFLKSGKIWPLCTPSLEWQQRAFPPHPRTPTSSLSEETCARLMDHLGRHHFLLLCVCAQERRRLALPIDTTCLSPEGIWFSNLYFAFCISWNFLTAIPCCSKFISSFLFLFLMLHVLVQLPPLTEQQLECSCWELSNYFVQKYISGPGNIICPCAWKSNQSVLSTKDHEDA